VKIRTKDVGVAIAVDIGTKDILAIAVSRCGFAQREDCPEIEGRSTIHVKCPGTVVEVTVVRRENILGLCAHDQITESIPIDISNGNVTAKAPIDVVFHLDVIG
jgi:hypothetical protein